MLNKKDSRYEEEDECQVKERGKEDSRGGLGYIGGYQV